MKTNTHKLAAWLVMLAMLMALIPGFTLTASAAPDTDYTGYYKIGNAGQLSWFACLVVGDTSQTSITEAVPDAKAVLTADIDITVLAERFGKTWSGIGTAEIPFTGIFDGNGYTIKGLTIDSSLTQPTVATIPVTTTHQGLFGVIGEGGVVRDVVLEGTASVSDGMKLGAVCSENNGTIENVLSMMTITGGDNPNAFCHTNNGTITNCYTNQIGTATGATLVDADALADGSVTYALGASFGQTIGTDTQPVHYNGSNKVYKIGNSYSNDLNSSVDWSGACDTANTHTVDVGALMPSDAEITSMQITEGVGSPILSGLTPSWTTNAASLKFVTKVMDEPTSGRVVLTVTTSNYGDITVTINITLTGKYIVNISALPQDALYDGDTHSGYSNLTGTLTSGEAYEGSYTYTYETSDGTALEGAPSKIGSYKVTIAVPEDNENYKGSLTLEFDITEDVEASYQTEADGEWISGAFTEALSNVYEGGTVKLLKDIVLTETVTVAKKVTITSDDANSLNKITSTTNQHGYLLRITADVEMENVIVDGGSADDITASRAMIAVGDGTNPGTLTLSEGAVVRNNNNTTANDAGGGICVILGDLVVSGGQITGNSAYSGSAIAVMAASCNVTIETGSVISGNSATSATSGGGAIYISEGTVTMTGGEIKNNNAAYSGGAVFLYSSNATFKLQGGTITGNTAKYGGGVSVSKAKLLELSGGSVMGNTAASWGGGLLVAPNSNVTISGSINISDNTNTSGEAGANLYLDGYEYNGIYFPNVTLGELDNTAKIDTYSWLKPSPGGELTVAAPANGYTITQSNLSKISYEDNAYTLVLSEGSVILVEASAASSYPVFAEKIDVPDIDTATINKDAVGYYVEGMQIDDTADTYKWVITMSDDAQYQSETNLPTLSGTGKVSFGIILYGTVGDYTTADISTVAVTQ